MMKQLCDLYPKSANCLRRRAIALPHSPRLCATAGTAPSPFLDGRKSVPSYSRINLCASVGVTGSSRSATCPRRHAIALPHSRRLCAPAGAAPITGSRWSKIGRGHHLRQLRASTGVTGYPRSANCPRRRAVTLPHSRRLCAAAGSVPPPLLDGRKSVAPTTCANLHASTGVTGYPRSANCPRRRAIALSWTTLVRRSGSPYPGLTLPPHVGRRCTCTMPHKAVENPKFGKLPRRRSSNGVLMRE